MDNYERRFCKSEQRPLIMNRRKRRRKKKHQQHQQPSSIRFNDDIFSEILLRLPVKSVVKFKTVSKLWLSISSNHSFRQNHASRRHKLAPIGLFFPVGQIPFSSRLLFNVDKPKISYHSYCIRRTKGKDAYYVTGRFCVSSCNGLLLIKLRKHNGRDSMYYVYNPTTQETKDILVPPHISKNKFVCASLAFDPYESLNYKVIFLWRQNKFSLNFQLEVYSSTTGTCKAPVSNTFDGLFNYDDNCGIFCNGAIHWLSSEATWIVYFNIYTECIKELQTPPSARNIIYIGESQGHLHLVDSDHEYFYESSFLDVYELKGDYSGWVQKYQVDLASFASVLPQQVYLPEDRGTYMSIIRYEDDDDDDLTMVLYARYGWVKYNFKMKTAKMLCESMPRGLLMSRFPWSYGFNTHQFIPTLTCI